MILDVYLKYEPIQNRLYGRHFNQKLSLEKTILRNIKILVRKYLSKRQFSRLKVFFTKTIFKQVHISNKHHKSHVWPKNLKKFIF